MTKTKEKYFEIQALRDAQQAEYLKVIRAEFPVGTKVRWKHGQNWIHGEVSEGANWDWSNDVEVRNNKSGSKSKKEARDLELL